MVEHIAAAEHDELALVDHPVHLEHAPVAGTIDADRTDDGDRQPLLPVEKERHLFAFGLGLLIDIPGSDRSVLVRRGLFDVTVHAAGAAVQHPAHPHFEGGGHDVLSAGDVDVPVGLVRLIGLAVERRNVIDHIDIAHRLGQIGLVLQVAGDNVHSLRLEPRGVARRPHKGAHLISPLHKIVDHIAAGESGGAGDQNPHRPSPFALFFRQHNRGMAEFVADAAGQQIVDRHEEMIKEARQHALARGAGGPGVIEKNLHCTEILEEIAQLLLVVEAGDRGIFMGELEIDPAELGQKDLPGILVIEGDSRLAAGFEHPLDLGDRVLGALGLVEHAE